MTPTESMEPTSARILVRSRHQAMDWSLVLVSQGIDTAIENLEGAWSLVLPARDYHQALKALQQYRRENRGWPWRQTLTWPHTHFDWAVLGWAGVLIFSHWLVSEHGDWRAAGVMEASAVLSGQWWRIFTAMTLHADVAHLATNLSIGIVLLGLAMGRYGTGMGLSAAYLAGAAGNLASLWLNVKPFQGLGASGMVMGGLGLLAAQTLPRRGDPQRPAKHLLGGVVAGFMLFVLFGLAPGTDIVAHFGGFLAGLLLGGVLVRAPVAILQNPKVLILSVSLLTTLIVLTWRLALKGT